MNEIRPLRINKYSSENELYPVSNLLKEECQWTCKNCLDKEAFVEFEFDVPIDINRIEIKNNYSAFIKISVISMTDSCYQPLLLSTPLMSSLDSIKGEGGDKVRSFDESHLIAQARYFKWKYLRVDCSQPFNKSIQYGLSSIKFYGVPSSEVVINQRSTGQAGPKIDISRLMNDDQREEWQPGSLFWQRDVSKSDGTTKRSIASVSSLPANDCHNTVKTKSQALITASSMKVDGSVSCNRESIGMTETDLTSDMGGDSVMDTELGGDETQNERTMSPVVLHQDNDDGCVMTGMKHSDDVTLDGRVLVEETESTASARPHISAAMLPSTECPPASSIAADALESSTCDQVLSGVTFVLSGYQGPSRNILRDNGLALGARYCPSWTKGCTHLICAFPNTPKFKEVNGNGIIVNDKWLLHCYDQKRHLCWRQYRVKGACSPVREGRSDSGGATLGMTDGIDCGGATFGMTDGTDGGGATLSMTDGTDGDSPRPYKRRRRSGPEQCDTDDEIEMVAMAQHAADEGHTEVCRVMSLPSLPSIFANISFFFYRHFDAADRRRLFRLVTVLGGIVHEYMCPAVQLVVTKSPWDHTFDEALRDHGHLRFISPLWIDECDYKRALCSLSPFEVESH